MYVSEPTLVAEDIAAVRTALPLPGEYVVVRLTPVAMVKHLNNPVLTNALSKISQKTYMAVVYRYLEELSPEKPWHLCQLHLLYDSLVPLRDTNLSYDRESSSTTDGSNSSIQPEPDPNCARLSVLATHKPRIQIQLIIARLRTRICELPRLHPHFVPTDVFHKMRASFIMMESTADTTRVPKYVECRHLLLERAPYPLFMPLRREVDLYEYEGGTPLLKLCLVPHVDYGFDLERKVARGKEFIDDHASIISVLLTHQPQMPLRARIPMNIVDINLRDFIVPSDIQPQPSPNTPPYLPISRQFVDMTNPYGFEQPTDEIPVAVPPAVLQSTSVTELPSRGLRFLLLQLRIIIMRPLSKNKHVPDDTPYIPFQEWEDHGDSVHLYRRESHEDDSLSEIRWSPKTPSPASTSSP